MYRRRENDCKFRQILLNIIKCLRDKTVKHCKYNLLFGPGVQLSTRRMKVNVPRPHLEQFLVLCLCGSIVNQFEGSSRTT